jgi:hypothetical protein
MMSFPGECAAGCKIDRRSQQVTNTGRSRYRYRQRVCGFLSWQPINMESVAIPGISVSAALHSFPWPLYRFTFIGTAIARNQTLEFGSALFLRCIKFYSDIWLFICFEIPLKCSDFQWLWHVLSFIMSSNFRISVSCLFSVYFPTVH